ncbi:MAG: hypothetical protein IID48_12970 [Proteobacteria bacterium]|nr:hypothetical protein [Pseudomonadota bacterium]
MRDDDDEFLRSIPPFLRRHEAPRPEAQRPEKTPAAPAAQTAAPRIVELAVPQAETVQAETVQAGQRARIELAFDNETAPDDAGAEDVAFQVTLPRSVVRQIRVLAAKKDTTQRAIVLRALRLAGLWVPEGTDVDRRGRTAKRRQQA